MSEILTKNCVNHKGICTVGIMRRFNFGQKLARCERICSEDH